MEAIAKETKITAPLRRKLIAFFKKQTKLAAKEVSQFDAKPKDVKLSKKGQEVLAVLNETDFGCYKDRIRKVVSTIIGEELPGKPEGGNFYDVDFKTPGLVLKVTQNYNGHNYPLDVPILLERVGRLESMTRPDGSEGNCLYEAVPGDGKLVLCTDKEIDKITDAQLATFLQHNTVLV